MKQKLFSGIKYLSGIFVALAFLAFLTLSIFNTAGCSGSSGGDSGATASSGGGGGGSDTTAPTDGALYATAGNTNVALSWSGFSDSGGIANYKLVFSTTAIPASCSAGTEIFSGTGTTYIHAGLTNGTIYYYRVCATDNASNTSTGVFASNTPNPATTELIILQKGGGTFVTADMAGTWNVHGLSSGDQGASEWIGWFYGQATSTAGGAVTFTSFLDSDGGTTLPSFDILITADGVVTITGDASFHGVMNSDKNLIVATMTDGSGSKNILIMQKGGGTFATADMAGTWNVHGLSSGDGSSGEIDNSFYGQGTATAGGTFTTTSFRDSDGGTTLDPPFDLSIAADGVVTIIGDPNFHGVMNSDKNLIVATTGDPFAKRIVIIQKAGGTFATADMAGTWNGHSLATAEAPQWMGWARIQLTIDASGNITFTSFLDSDGGTTLPTVGLPAVITSDGIFTIPDNPSMHGVMNLSKDLVVMTDYWSN